MALYTMKELLADAQEKKYGIGYFNAVNMEMVRAYIRAAEEADSPIIIGTAEVLLPIASFSWIGPLLIEQAKNARVPVAVHLDHTYSFDVLMGALRAGFGSVMYDGTRERDPEVNVQKSAEIVKIAHGMGVGVECELGNVDALVYTEPEEAEDFIDRTDADFLAVSIGTAHGVYKATPKLDIPRLREIRAAVDVPLVLHGGSGLSDDDFRNTIEAGISKVNIYTDIIMAGKKAIAENPDALYTELILKAEDAMKNAAVEKLNLFGSAGKA